MFTEKKYNSEHHRKIHEVLKKLNCDFLNSCECYFGGGTAISLILDEYRESVDIDFVCASDSGYKQLRESIFDFGFKQIGTDVQLSRDVKSDHYGIRTAILIDGIPIKFEIIKESRLKKITPGCYVGIPVVCLSKSDMFTEKVLANTDRFKDKHVLSRDIIDLIAMEHAWGVIPEQSFVLAEHAYGKLARLSIDKAYDMISDSNYLNDCFQKMNITDEMQNIVKNKLSQIHETKNASSFEFKF